jgi:lipopolysaccharide export system permease protein
VFKDPTIRTFNPESGEITDIARLPSEDLALSRTPDDFQASVPDNEEMGYRQLRAIAQKLQSEGYDATRQRVDLSGRLANPFASVIMAFLGIPFALRKGRGTSLAVGISLSVGIGIAYHIIQAILIAFGYSGALPPMLAAWSANLLFGLLGVWLLLTARQ